MRKLKILIGCILGIAFVSLITWISLQSLERREIIQKAQAIQNPFEVIQKSFFKELLNIVKTREVYAAPGDPAYELLQKGDKYFENLQFDEAISCYEELIDKYPNSKYVYDAWIGLEGCWGYKAEFANNASEFYEKMIEVAKVIINKYPNDPHIGLTYGIVACGYSEIKDYNSAIVWFEKAFEKFKEISDREEMAHITLCVAIIYCFKEEYKKSLDKFLEALDKYLDTAWIKSLEGLIHASIGELYGRVGEIENKPEYFNKAIEYSKIGIEKRSGIFDLGEPCWNIAVAYDYGKKDIEKAKIWYKKIINEYPNSEYVIAAKKRLEELEK
jgi:tetratricopeptide (TPR) repeat protein